MSLPTINRVNKQGVAIDNIVRYIKANTLISNGAGYDVSTTSDGSLLSFNVGNGVFYNPMQYVGEFSPDFYYAVGNIVSVSADNTSSVLNNALPGMYVCTTEVPEKNYSDWLIDNGYASSMYVPYLRDVGVNYMPQFPEPNTASYWKYMSSKGGGINYRGEWNATSSYQVGDIVRVTVNPVGAEYAFGVNYTGTWIAAQNSTNTQPRYPELDTYGFPNIWELLSLGVRTMNVADSLEGSKKMYVAGSDSFPSGY